MAVLKDAYGNPIGGSMFYLGPGPEDAPEDPQARLHYTVLIKGDIYVETSPNGERTYLQNGMATSLYPIDVKIIINGLEGGILKLGDLEWHGPLSEHRGYVKVTNIGWLEDLIKKSSPERYQQAKHLDKKSKKKHSKGK